MIPDTAVITCNAPRKTNTPILSILEHGVSVGMCCFALSLSLWGRVISEGFLQMVLVVRVRLTRKPAKKKSPRKQSRCSSIIPDVIDALVCIKIVTMIPYDIRQFADPEQRSHIRPTRGYDSKCDGLNTNTGRRASAALRSSLLSCAARAVFSFRAYATCLLYTSPSPRD